MYKIVERGAGWEKYTVQFDRGQEAKIRMTGATNSCGIQELNGVGDFIENLRRKGLSPSEIAKELKTASKKILKEEGGCRTMLSLVETNFRTKVCDELVKGGAVASKFKRNNNSGNKINVVVI